MPRRRTAGRKRPRIRECRGPSDGPRGVPGSEDARERFRGGVAPSGLGTDGRGRGDGMATRRSCVSSDVMSRAVESSLECLPSPVARAVLRRRSFSRTEPEPRGVESPTIWNRKTENVVPVVSPPTFPAPKSSTLKPRACSAPTRTAPNQIPIRTPSPSLRRVRSKRLRRFYGRLAPRARRPIVVRARSPSPERLECSKGCAPRASRRADARAVPPRCVRDRRTRSPPRTRRRLERDTQVKSPRPESLAYPPAPRARASTAGVGVVERRRTLSRDRVREHRMGLAHLHLAARLVAVDDALERLDRR